MAARGTLLLGPAVRATLPRPTAVTTGEPGREEGGPGRGRAEGVGAACGRRGHGTQRSGRRGAGRAGAGARVAAPRIDDPRRPAVHAPPRAPGRRPLRRPLGEDTADRGVLEGRRATLGAARGRGRREVCSSCAGLQTAFVGMLQPSRTPPIPHPHSPHRTLPCTLAP
ncbi:hypothetical protein E2C01_092778 [Portunus trituberculatus]|uniref:Uncharacterized protein n=1 Tax=Portunus trituberculatus TaxID=210409 RepID=A0A5B7JHB6_PORTR|nr:hypothetical protein [Portunus trituberculatus]